jgi:hypothetical protein
MQLQPDQSQGFSFPTGAYDPSTSIITISAQRFWKGSIHPSAWKGNSAKLNFAYHDFSEVAPAFVTPHTYLR